MDDHLFTTGAARGLGLAMTRQLLGGGCTVSALVRSENDALRELRSLHGERLAAYPGRRPDLAAVVAGIGLERFLPRALGQGLEQALDQRRRQVGRAWSDRILSALLYPFAPPLKLLLMKDWRLLRRDPVQWSQFLIFFGLLGLYFLNVDRFNNPQSDIGYATWINMVSFLNLAVVGLILSTFTTRFIYPMISLEGHCFWILGLLPIERDVILWSIIRRWRRRLMVGCL